MTETPVPITGHQFRVDPTGRWLVCDWCGFTFHPHVGIQTPEIPRDCRGSEFPMRRVSVKIANA